MWSGSWVGGGRLQVIGGRETPLLQNCSYRQTWETQLPPSVPALFSQGIWVVLKYSPQGTTSSDTPPPPQSEKAKSERRLPFWTLYNPSSPQDSLS